jgi:SAM-dependent methyltransferase
MREFATWALEQITIPAGARVLDAGCGWGRFLEPRLIASDAQLDVLTLADLSHDALPFANATFDIALVHEALHLSDYPAQAIDEIARMLKSKGALLATTHNDRIAVPIIDLHYAALAFLDIPYLPEPPSPFSMHNGGQQLARAFAKVDRFDFVDQVIHADRDAFVDSYIGTGRYRAIMGDSSIDTELRAKLAPAFAALARERFPDPGPVLVPVEMCAFVCGGKRGLGGSLIRESG